ncbi:MAG: hypothetical protein H7328_12435 [Bdellovibrio sp.]|nr:hypothetical protein [Bdellovibrio sp.]
MRKWLILFVIVDFIFVGLVLRISMQQERQIASVESESNLSAGQQNKFELVKSLHFKADSQQLVLQTEKLQMICETSSLIEVKYRAVNVAYAGAQPTITHTFSCVEIKKDLSLTTLQTNMSDFISMQKNKKLNLNVSQMTAAQVYSDEDFPSDWQVSEITVTGPSTFTINQFEIEKVHANNSFSFTITSVR